MFYHFNSHNDLYFITFYDVKSDFLRFSHDIFNMKLTWFWFCFFMQNPFYVWVHLSLSGCCYYCCCRCLVAAAHVGPRGTRRQEVRAAQLLLSPSHTPHLSVEPGTVPVDDPGWATHRPRADRTSAAWGMQCVEITFNYIFNSFLLWDVLKLEPEKRSQPQTEAVWDTVNTPEDVHYALNNYNTLINLQTTEVCQNQPRFLISLST